MKPYIMTLVFGVLAFLSACAEVEPVKAPVDVPARIYVANRSSEASGSVIGRPIFSRSARSMPKTNRRMTWPSVATGGACTPRIWLPGDSRSSTQRVWKRSPRSIPDNAVMLSR